MHPPIDPIQQPLLHFTCFPARKTTTKWSAVSHDERSIAEYLVQPWDVRNSCKHNGAVLPLPSAPEGRGADGVDAMA
jgi:hypothetical protein